MSEDKEYCECSSAYLYLQTAERGGDCQDQHASCPNGRNAHEKVGPRKAANEKRPHGDKDSAGNTEFRFDEP